ncbi:MAG: hypothetical protein KF773_01215 [Deltaproteobacteria bacterium]|nr:hypothetical protein [Deltaproteobacteria bacterium]
MTREDREDRDDRDDREEDRGDDDPMMRSMRSVWLSMRDEDPPATGLEALLAAARTNAVAMQPKPSRWQTFLATLRRPPVLAFATVVVLVGGAVAIGRRGGMDSSMPTIEAPPPAVPAQAPPPSREPADGEAQVQPTPAPDPRDEPSPEPQVVKPPGDAVKPVPPTRPVPGGEAPARPARPSVTGPTTAESKQEGAPPVTPPEVPMTDDHVAGPKSEPLPPQVQEEKLSIAHDADAPESEHVRLAPAQSKTPAVDATSSTKSTVKTAPSEQLVKQTESAAARGDCAAVRATAERLRKTDATTYKARIASNASIARCLK